VIQNAAQPGFTTGTRVNAAAVVDDHRTFTALVRLLDGDAPDARRHGGGDRARLGA